MGASLVVRRPRADAQRPTHASSDCDDDLASLAGGIEEGVLGLCRVARLDIHWTRQLSKSATSSYLPLTSSIKCRILGSNVPACDTFVMPFPPSVLCRLVFVHSLLSTTRVVFRGPFEGLYDMLIRSQS